MNEAIKELIRSVQEGRKIGAYKAVEALGVEPEEARALVREVWLALQDRHAFTMGQYAKSVHKKG